MNRFATFAVVLLAAHALPGCEAKPEPKPVSYYMSHPVEREDLMASCKAMGDARQTDGDCINAGKAWLASWGVRPIRPAVSQADLAKK